MMVDSAKAKKIDGQCARYQHLHTGVIYRLVMEAGGVCWLENVTYESLQIKRRDLDDAECWRQMP